MTPQLEAREQEVAKQILAVQRMYVDAFTWKGEEYPPRAVYMCMRDTEHAFSEAVDYVRELATEVAGDLKLATTLYADKLGLADHLYDQAAYLAEVTARMIAREAPKFAADPKRWVEQREELRT